MSDDLKIYAEAARTAVENAGQIARAGFGRMLEVAAKGSRGDLVTSVDYECEELIVDLLRSKFPHHGLEAEETGQHFTDSEFRWVVDPLDGTNNYVYGLPAYGCAVTLCHYGEPVVSAIGEGNSGAVAVAVKGEGVWVDPAPVPRSAAAPVAPERTPASALWTGYDTAHEPVLAKLISALHGGSHRVFSTWAPTVDVFLYLRGGVNAIAAYQCKGHELLGCLLMVQEAGGAIVDVWGEPVASLGSLPELSFAGEPWAISRLVETYASR